MCHPPFFLHLFPPRSLHPSLFSGLLLSINHSSLKASLNPPPHLATPPFFLSLSTTHPTCLSKRINSSETLFTPLSKLHWFVLAHTQKHTGKHTSMYTQSCSTHSQILAHTAPPLSPPPRTRPLSSHAEILLYSSHTASKSLSHSLFQTHTHAHARAQSNETTGLLISTMNVRQFEGPPPPPPHSHKHTHTFRLARQSNSKSRHL